MGCNESKPERPKAPVAAPMTRPLQQPIAMQPVAQDPTPARPAQPPQGQPVAQFQQAQQAQTMPNAVQAAPMMGQGTVGSYPQYGHGNFHMEQTPMRVGPVAPAPAPPPASGVIYVAKYTYAARTPEDLSFNVGEQLTIIESSGPWWTAVNERGQRGFIPSNFVVSLDSMDRHEWYHGKVRRLEAEKMLSEQPVGTFMIRDSESKPGEYSLSVKDTAMVKHYRVRAGLQGEFFITRQNTFATITGLVDHYRSSSDGLCARLSYPCPKRAQGTVDLDYKTAQNWEVDRKDVEIIRKLGKGEFGEVWYGKWNGKTEVAVKMLKPGSANQEEFLKEATVMKQIQHDKLIKLFAVVTKSEPMLLITEYMSKGALLTLLRAGHNYKEAELIDMASQIAEGMAYLEEHNFIHRDLAARNVLVNNDNQCKVADFGLARVVNLGSNNDDDDSQGFYSAHAGAKFPVKWTAPEVLEEVNKGYRMPCPDKCPDYVYKIMLDCWKATPEDRPTFDSLASKLSDMVVNPNNYQETSAAQ